ncbi:Hpt domain-containing protein [Bradyrhizobium diazoefficiens]|jgi:HPt (histidine-containing phosphotransfer) domain-containing protein|nr:Hpt domain-containing protein [Bradyrhizobium diazoefficiens]MBR0967846.1 Hpt domain-containing protein [Bradyrhizobium diazoefficiens]MBR0981240.1 Hpt domain-containing protein [Bradyrhizobium diazoefficiens]MBR1010697.1 Hpt domain-containing protein [Bradyrhizobium diazoefficiens]MBR1015704.1 Hpt domain-containing protein [Bradyrhizobium diazoefficiens]MBR1054690.1 Hpt domain-containing protein [Bradyrhizobium diazoefficiens]
MTGFDKDVLRLLISELGPEDTAEVLRAFLDDTGRKIAVLGAEPPDPALIRQEAHSIKSSAATFGFLELSTLAQSLEQQASLMRPDQLASATATLRKVFEQTTEFARSVLLASNMEIVR